jgi:hypothetical protein
MEDDIKKEIHEVTERYIERYFDAKYDAMNQVEENIREASHDIFANQDRIMNRMNEIEKLVNSHAVGVKNVYEEMKEINKIRRINIILEE